MKQTANSKNKEINGWNATVGTFKRRVKKDGLLKFSQTMTASVLYIIVKTIKNKITGQTGKASTKYFKKFPRMYHVTKIKI